MRNKDLLTAEPEEPTIINQRVMVARKQNQFHTILLAQLLNAHDAARCRHPPMGIGEFCGITIEDDLVGPPPKRSKRFGRTCASTGCAQMSVREDHDSLIHQHVYRTNEPAAFVRTCERIVADANLLTCFQETAELLV